MTCPNWLPGFRASCVGVGVVYVLLSLSLFARGMAAAMAEYGVPAEVLAAPHYIDAISWVYVHMAVLGLAIAVVGWFAESARLKAVFARLMVAAHVVYVFLDFRSAEWALGTGLYEGPRSLGPAIVATIVLGLFVHLALCPDPPDRDGSTTPG